MTEAQINGHRMSYDDRGAGTPVLFIHGGYGGAASTLAPTRLVIRDALPAGSFRVITYDRRGAGASEYVEADYTLEDLAADGVALLDHLAIEKAIVVGTSAGGPIALQLALSEPGRVIALALPNTGANLMNQERDVSRQRAALVERVRQDGARAVFDTRKHRLRTPAAQEGQNQAAQEDAGRRERLEKALAELAEDDLFVYSKGEIANFAAYLGFDFTDRLGELKMPVCVIHGTADQTVPFAWGRALQEAIPGSEFHAIEGGRHGILSNPEAAAALRTWASRFSTTATPA